MPDRERDPGGEFSETVSDDDLLVAVRDHAPASTSEVADTVGLTRQAVDYRLRRLRDEGRVSSKKIGAALVWSAEKEDAKPRSEGESTARTPPSTPEEPPSPTPSEGDTTDEGVPADIEVDPDVAAFVEELDIPGAGTKAEKRRAALAEILTYMRDTGAASREEILTIAARHDHGGYASEASFRSNVWANHALPQLKERGVVPDTDTTGVYEWAGLE